ncbi:hypothetical protein Plo01_76650 [Planobispora longispora]|uniref:Restriction endonuclease type IV Mrr domain-containing protein n=1 Tax=Planobispora longispora TaxID=28887 RepID=A0A8J3RQV6_9ACTN|nr:hypothetical protein Plo01_76650 [Planobispora longispora]
MRGLAADDRDLRLVDLLKVQDVLLDHRGTSGAAVLRRAAPAGRIPRASASSARTADPAGGRRPPRPPYNDNTPTSCPPFPRRHRVRPPILRHDPGLAASPPARYTLEVARSEISSPLLRHPHPAQGADIAVIVTNGSFTRDARRHARAFRIPLLGRGELARWAADGLTLHRLLRLSPPLRRWRRLRHTATTSCNGRGSCHG